MYKKSKVLKAIRKELEGGSSFEAAWRKAGLRSSFTIYRWMKDRPLIKRYVEKCKEICQEVRDIFVEDKFIDRLIKGEASESGYLFYLQSRMPDKYKDMRAVFHNNPTFVNKVEGNLLKLIQEMPTDELRRIISVAKGNL